MNNQKSERPLLPPEVFIKKMNNLYPNIWAAIKKNRENIYSLKENGRPVIMEFPSWMEMTSDLVHYTIMHNDAYREVLALSKAMGTDYYIQRIDELTAMAPVYAWKKSKNVYTIPSDLGWDDVGSWKSLERYIPKDESDNIIKGEVKVIDSKNNVIYGNGKRIILLNVNDIFCIDSNDVIIIGDRKDLDKVQRLKDQ